MEEVSGWDVPRSRDLNRGAFNAEEDDGLLDEDESSSEDDEDISIKEIIRRAGRKALSKQPPPEAQPMKGLKKHPLTDVQSDLRWYNRFIALTAAASMVFAVWQVSIVPH